MASLPQDLFAIILAKLPLKSIATSKLVCKQWKSILESMFFYHLFQSHHQHSHSLWSLMCLDFQKEVIAHYGCTSWGLTRSLGFYISSFITSLVHTEGLHGHPKESVRVAACSDVGLILISFANPGDWYKTYYVANPISREYVKIPPLIPCISWETTFTLSGLVTQVVTDIVLSYKIVLVKQFRNEGFEYDICLLIYSSETGLWSFKTIRSPLCFKARHSISLNGNLYWIGFLVTLRKFVVVYFNFYVSGTESDRFRVVPFPSVEKKDKLIRVCTTSQGSLMYITIVSEDKYDGSFEHKLSVWRLKSGEWQLVSVVSLDCMIPGFDEVQYLKIDPFNAKTVYFGSNVTKRLAFINLDNGKMGLHNNLECCSHGCNQKVSEEWNLKEGFSYTPLCMVVLPRWLYRIPCSFASY